MCIRDSFRDVPSPIWGSISKYRPPCFPFPDFPPYPVETPHIHGTPSTEGTFTRYLFPCMRQWWGHRFCNFCGSETPGSRPAPSNRHRKAPDSRQRAGQGAPNESQNRPRRRQWDANGTPRAQKGGQGRRQRAPTPPLASPKTAQHRPKAVPKLAQKYATRRKRETVVENGPPGFARG